MSGIKFSGMDIYHFNVSFLFLVSFCLHTMDCTALGTSAHFFEMVHLVVYFTSIVLVWGLYPSICYLILQIDILHYMLPALLVLEFLRVVGLACLASSL